MSMGAAPTRAAAGNPVLWTALSEPSIELRQGQSCTWQHRLPCRATEHGFLWTFSLCYLKWRDGQGRAGRISRVEGWDTYTLGHSYIKTVFAPSLFSSFYFLKTKKGKGPWTDTAPTTVWSAPDLPTAVYEDDNLLPNTPPLSCMCPTVGTGCGGQRTTCQSFSPPPPRKRQGLFDRMHTCAYTYANTHACKQSHGTQFSLLTVLLNETNDMSTKYKGGTQSFCDALSK